MTYRIGAGTGGISMGMGCETARRYQLGVPDRVTGRHTVLGRKAAQHRRYSDRRDWFATRTFELLFGKGADPHFTAAF